MSKRDLFTLKHLIYVFFLLFFVSRPNVCTERKEELSDWESPSSQDEDKKETDTQLRQAQSVHFGVHISLNSCYERTNKHVCKTM